MQNVSGTTLRLLIIQKNKRKEVLNRVFTIVGIKSDNGKIDEDTIIEIDDDISFVEVYADELKKV